MRRKGLHGLIKVLGPMRPLVVPDPNALKCSNPLQVPIWEISLPNLGNVEVISTDYRIIEIIQDHGRRLQNIWVWHEAGNYLSRKVTK